MPNEALVRAVDVCVQKMQAGEKMEQALELYPQWSGELTPPLEAAQVLRVYSESLSRFPDVPLQEREQFLISAQELNQKTDQDSAARSWVVRLTWMVVVLCIAIAATWFFAVVAKSLPGDSLYSLKERYWQTRLALISDPVQRLIQERNYDQARLQDMLALSSRAQAVSVVFPGLLEQSQPDNWTVGGIPVQISPQTQIVGEILNHTWVEVSGDLNEDGSVKASKIRPREYRFTGLLQEVSLDELRISGIPVKLSSQTLVHGAPMAGSQVMLIAYRAADDSLIARLVEASELNP